MQVFRRMAHRELAQADCSNLYTRVLAALDAAICLSYLWLFGGDALAHYLKLHRFYLLHTYSCIPVFASARIIRLASVWVTVAATLERLIRAHRNQKALLARAAQRQHFSGRFSAFSQTSAQQLTCRKRRLMSIVSRRTSSTNIRYAIMAGIIFFSISLRAITLFEVQLVHYPRPLPLYKHTLLSAIICTASDCPVSEIGGSVAVEPTQIGQVLSHYYFDFYFIFTVQV